MPNNVSKCVFAISLHIVRPSHHLVPVDIHCSTSCCVRYILYIFLCWLEYFSIVFGCCFSPTTINFPALSCSFFTIFCLSWFSHYAPSHRDKVDMFPTLPTLVFKMCDTKCASNIFPFFQQLENLWCGDKRGTFDSFNDFAISMQISVSPGRQKSWREQSHLIYRVTDKIAHFQPSELTSLFFTISHMCVRWRRPQLPLSALNINFSIECWKAPLNENQACQPFHFLNVNVFLKRLILSYIYFFQPHLILRLLKRMEHETAREPRVFIFISFSQIL